MPNTIPSRPEHPSTAITPVRPLPRASAAIAAGETWEDTLDALLGQLDIAHPDLLLLFASTQFAEHFPALVHTAWERSGAMLLAGCSTTGPVAEGIEAEHQPAIAALALSLPGATLRPSRFTQALIEAPADPDSVRERLGIDEADVNGWLLFSDPHRSEPARTVGLVSSAYPGAPVVGGLATAPPNRPRSWVFLNGETYADGGVGIAIGGDYDLLPIVAQGCEPIGETWTITGAHGEWVTSISNRPALTMLAETLEILPVDMQQEAESNLVAGLAANEYQDKFGRGDFLIRNITAIDWERGALALAAQPRIGQTIQFHLRDAATASLDLTLALTESHNQLGDSTPVAAVLTTCNGRGSTLFGIPDHDAAELARRFPGLPHAGMIAAGEIGPAGKRNAVHGFAASIGLIVRNAPDSRSSTNAEGISPA